MDLDQQAIGTEDTEEKSFDPRGHHAERIRSLLSRRAPLASPERQLDLLRAVKIAGTDGEPVRFDRSLASAGWKTLPPAELEIFQINLGKLCNMTCRHCHVDAGPDRVDAMMSDATIESCWQALDRTQAHTVDLTGGAPELHPRFREVVECAVQRGKHVIDRCNLSVLLLDRFAGLAEWMGERGVEIVASLPHHRKRNTDTQRGDGAYDQSIKAIRLLNAAGYGMGDPHRVLTLMSNPAGAFLAGDQREMEPEWKTALQRDWDVHFDRLLALNNMPISRYLEWLESSGNLEGYMERIVGAFNPASIPGLMCRNTLSVSWDGRIFDCDFNQMLDIECDLPGGLDSRIEDFDPEAWRQRRIVTAPHCYGCTAGSGSGCGGATA